jgi:hypothetical protein
MKSKVEAFNRDIKNPFMKKFVDALLKPVDDMKTRERSNKVLQGVATAVDSALFNLPSKIKPVKNFIDEFKDSNPKLSRTAEIAGDIGGSLVAGGAAVKALTKVDKLKKILQGGKWYNTAAKAGVYNVAGEVPHQIFNDTHPDAPEEKAADIVRAGLGGMALGGLGHGAAFLIKPAVKSMGIKNPFRKPMQIRNEVGRELYDTFDKKTINHIKHIVDNPIESKNLNLNTLLHRGDESVQAMIDKLHQKSPSVREMIKKESAKLAEGQMPHIRESIIKNSGLYNRPDVTTYVKNSKRKIDSVTESLYDKAKKIGKIEVPEFLKNDPRFIPAVENAYKEMNLLQKGKSGYEKHSVRNLHRAKNFIGDDVSKFRNWGDKTKESLHQQTYNMLKDTLNKASPDYEKATNIYKKYFDIRNAAKKGLDFKDQNIEEIINDLGKMSGRERHAYKTGAVQSLLEKAESRSQNSKLTELGKDFTNAEIKRKLDKIIGESKLDKIVRDIEASNAAVKNIRDITGGSGTSKHESNKQFFSGIFAALRGSPKGVINTLAGAGEHVKEKKAFNEAALKMRLLLNPKKLLEFSKVPPKETGNLIPSLTGIYNTKGNSEKKEEKRIVQKRIEERKKNPIKEKTYAEEINDIYKKYGR